MLARLALCLLTLGTPPAAPRPDRLTAARAELSRGNFDQALKDLDAALAEVNDLATLSQLELVRAQAFGAKQDYHQAEGALAQALEFDPEAQLDAGRIDPALVKLLESLRGRLTGELRVESERPARVKVDGADHGAAPLRLELPIGRHLVEGATEEGTVFAREQVLIRRSGT